ncbi:hypothetical protein GLA29479_2369 [Lysobacter antibioticus]|nr:hypothetical protein GLA29479_2369 [Lysobacter antibioticus]
MRASVSGAARRGADCDAPYIECVPRPPPHPCRWNATNPAARTASFLARIQLATSGSESKLSDEK